MKIICWCHRLIRDKGSWTLGPGNVLIKWFLICVVYLLKYMHYGCFGRKSFDLLPTFTHLGVMNITFVLFNISSKFLMWVRIPPRRGVLDTTLCDKVCQWLATGRWFSLGTPVSSTNKTNSHDITEILLKVALKSITLLSKLLLYLECCLLFPKIHKKVHFK